MKTNQVMFGLLALAMLASVGFAQPIDYNDFVKTGGCLRYLGPEISYPYLVTPMGHPDEYQEVEMSSINYYKSMVLSECPKENGVPVCSS